MAKRIRYRVIKDFEDRGTKRVYKRDEFVELSHEESEALVNRGILTREGARKPPAEGTGK